MAYTHAYIYSGVTHMNVHVHNASKQTQRYVYIDSYTHSYTHTHVHTHIPTYMHTCIHTPVLTFGHTCIHTHTNW